MHKDLLIDIDFFKVKITSKHFLKNKQNRTGRFLANIGPHLRLMSFGRNEYVCTEGEYANESKNSKL